MATALDADGRPLALLQQHELVQGIVPLHQEDAAGRRSAQVLVAIVRIPRHTALRAALCVRHLGGQRELAWHQTLRDLVHVQREAHRLLGVQGHQVVSVELAGFTC